VLRLLQLRIMASLGAGALAVHELRYLAAFGSRSEEALAHQGHAYLNTLTPLVGLALAGVLGHVLYRLAWGREATDRRGPSRAAAAAAFAAGLLAIYIGQELLEGAVATGHPAGWHGVFGHGGWLAVPFSAGLGLALSLLVGCARAAVARARRVLRLPVFRPIATPSQPPALGDVTPAAAPLARHLAGRAPPFVVA
jgi:hypothetical protein